MASEEGWPLRGSPMVMEGGRRLGNYLNTKVINFLDTRGLGDVYKRQGGKNCGKRIRERVYVAKHALSKLLPL